MIVFMSAIMQAIMMIMSAIVSAIMSAIMSAITHARYGNADWLPRNGHGLGQLLHKVRLVCRDVGEEGVHF